MSPGQAVTITENDRPVARLVSVPMVPPIVRPGRGPP